MTYEQFVEAIVNEWVGTLDYKFPLDAEVTHLTDWGEKPVTEVVYDEETNTVVLK